MSARPGFNAANIQDGPMVAAIVGVTARSGVVFAIAASFSNGVGLLGGEIRPGRRSR